MNIPSSRKTIAGRVIIAHAVGLWITGMVSTIGTSAGFSIAGGGLGLFLGGLLSLPWMATLAVVIWFYGGLIKRHPLLFAFTGPILVCGSYALLAGAFWEAVAVSSAASSICYLALVGWGHFRSTSIAKN